MTAAACSVTACGKPVVCRGLCSGHYQRLNRYGDPTHVPAHRAGPKPGPRPYRRKPAVRPSEADLGAVTGISEPTPPAPRWAGLRRLARLTRRRTAERTPK